MLETGTRSEFKRSVMDAIWVDMCIECLCDFHTFVKPVMNSWARCPGCKSRKSEVEFAHERYRSFARYIYSAVMPPPNNPPQ